LGNAVRRLARGLAMAGHVVHVCTLHSDLLPGQVRTADEEGVVVHRLGPQKKTHDTLTEWFELLTDLGQRDGFQVLHGYFAAYAGFLAVYAARYLAQTSKVFGDPGSLSQAGTNGRGSGPRAVVSVRGNDLDRLIFDPARAPYIFYALRHADAITAVTQDLARKARVLGERDDVYLVPNGVDGELFRPGAPPPELRSHLGLDDRPVLGFVGEARRKKGLPLLLLAFARLNATTPAHLLLIGGVRPKDADIYELFRRQHPHLSVQMVPYLPQEELVGYYNLLDIVVFPSRRDGLPNALLEAMACARPVVAAAVGGIPDVITDGVDGVLVPPRDEEALVKALLALLSDPARRRALGEAARRKVLREYTPQQELERYLEVYQSIA